MRITLFTCNQPRHINLVKLLSQFADEVYVVSEVSTVFPGLISDFFKNSKIMNSYFEKVIDAETKLFGEISFLPKNVKSLSIKSGDLNLLSQNQLSEALKSNLYIVFGGSFIKGWLVDFLIKNNAINIHMGLSPYYRGSSCNFWALYDNKPSFVGATIHILSKGLDSGKIIFHCIPKYIKGDSVFDFSMRSVAAAHFGILNEIKNGNLFKKDSIIQNKNYEVRYTKNSDFTDTVAKKFLEMDYKIDINELIYPELKDPVFY